MKQIFLYLSLLFLVCSCISIKADATVSDIEVLNDSEIEANINITLQDSLAFQLCQIYGSDQGVREPYITGGKINYKYVQKIDSLNFKKVAAFVKQNGFPTKELLGARNYKNECVQAAVVSVLLHNPHILVKNEEYFNLFLNEVKRGNLKAETYATILDKYYWAKRGNKNRVLYGSQFGMPCKNTREESNAARVKIGLEPLNNDDFIDCED
ncbi:MAG: hypothetical protein BM557_07620 [Flavobacterium sp. MedPE-SWcel]|mgnify:CR=1 FL=1|uniref:hypothetical protein n=1 Tax=uncultured Flavobacterium sp. TaxID=165435 RepID=UPI000912DFAB|nr:hypothetical protein [uncultured Flavobacterium sp.]OIQ18076.1 MAG: hypothetical protein BM557_07620 [Flavobacterium sp. MedPE-SWcel]